MIVGPMIEPTAWCDHEYSVIEQKDATCTETGHTRKHCSLCDDEVVEIIDIYHIWSEVETIEATCSASKQIVNQCSKCGIVETKNEGNPIEHTWIQESILEATCSAPKQITSKCSVCGVSTTFEEGTTTNHSFGEWNVSIVPTVENEGQKTRECSVCKKVENEVIPKITYIAVTANELWNAFSENEVAAEQKYEGKTVRITGVISDINSADTFTSANVLLNVDNSYLGCVQCNFSSKNAEAIANLNKGTSVTIEGTCGKISLFNLMVNACKVIE
jgi:hypothetical protein